MPRMVGIDPEKVVSVRTLCEGPRVRCSEGSNHGAKIDR